jgi:uncharacterized membrane protein YbhN (UPF0104 family)
MAQAARDDARRSTISPIGIAGALAGVVLFGWYLHAAGLADVLDGIQRIGMGFVMVLVLSGLRLALRAAAWMQCVEDGRLSFRHALSAFLAGDALGNITPLGPVASEGVKALLARRRLRGLSALSSLALENLFYTLTVAAVLVLGALAFLVAFQPDPGARAGSVIVAAAAILTVAAVGWLLYGQPRLLSRSARSMATWRPQARLDRHLVKLQRLDDRIHGFASRHPRRVLAVLALETGFQVASVAEIYLLLILLVDPAAVTLVQALILETINRVTMVLFKFVPLRVGVDEAGSGLVAQALALGNVPGIAIALARKARTIFWSAIGLGVLMYEGLSVSGAVSQAAAEIERDQPVFSDDAY